MSSLMSNLVMAIDSDSQVRVSEQNQEQHPTSDSIDYVSLLQGKIAVKKRQRRLCWGKRSKGKLD